MLRKRKYKAPMLTEKRKKKPLGRYCVSLPVCIVAIILSAAITAGCMFFFFHSGNTRKITTKLREVDMLVNRYYTGEVDYEVLDDAVLSAYMKGLGDKYGFYESKEDAEAVADSFSGDTTGIGVTVYHDTEKDGLAVFRVDNASPAKSAGVLEGDVITAVDGETVAELGYTESVNAIRREVGKTAELTILRANKEIKITVKYAAFVKQSVYTEEIGKTGYLCFTAFNEATVAQFKQAMEDFKKSGVTALIFDVRDNGGGTVDSVCEILDELVGKCDLMTVEYVDGKKRVTHKSDAKETNLPMAVLTNGSTASASELFAATLRDTKKAALIGQKTYGKGVMQRTYFLTDGSCVRFTVGKFYPVGGVCFNEIGLEPDITVTLTEQEGKKPYIPPKEDPVVRKALEHLEG